MAASAAGKFSYGNGGAITLAGGQELFSDAALRGENNKSRRLLDAVIAYEQGGWDRCMNLSADAGMERLVVPFAYGKALQWYRQFKTISDGSAPAGGRTGA